MISSLSSQRYVLSWVSLNIYLIIYNKLFPFLSPILNNHINFFICQPKHIIQPLTLDGLSCLQVDMAIPNRKYDHALVPLDSLCDNPILVSNVMPQCISIQIELTIFFLFSALILLLIPQVLIAFPPTWNKNVHPLVIWWLVPQDKIYQN